MYINNSVGQLTMQESDGAKAKRLLRVAIHQPNFLPRVKVLQKLAYADIWCVLDSVQYCAREWQNRARIVPVHGNNESFWLSIPVHRPHGRATAIREVTVVEPHLIGPLMERTLRHAFHSAPHWSAIENFLSSVMSDLAADNITSLCVETTKALLHLAQREPKIILTSSLPVLGKASDLMGALCHYLNATTYLADSGARNYLQPVTFKDTEVIWQNWCEPTEVWPGISSWRNISSVNYLCRVGPEQFAKHVLSAEFNIEPTWQTPVYNSISGQSDTNAT